MISLTILRSVSSYPTYVSMRRVNHGWLKMGILEHSQSAQVDARRRFVLLPCSGPEDEAFCYQVVVAAPRRVRQPLNLSQTF